SPFGRFEVVRNLLVAFCVPHADGYHACLNVGQPNWKSARVVSDQNAEDPLYRPVRRAMHHQRLLARTVFGNVFQTKSLRQVEIELNRAKLPWTANGIDQLHVNLGAVESGLAGYDLVFDISALQRVLQRAVAQVPLLLGAE